jgi:hypothetical protein
MVGWPWSRAGEGADGAGHSSEAAGARDMDSGSAAAQPHVEKDVLAAGRTACYKVHAPLLRSLLFEFRVLGCEACISFLALLVSIRNQCQRPNIMSKCNPRIATLTDSPSRHVDLRAG